MFSRPAPPLPTGLTILDAIEDPALLGATFQDLATWRTWLVALKAIFALAMSEHELEIYRRHTGRHRAPASLISEFWAIVGRRGGKTFIAALVSVFIACFRDYSEVLSRGERGVVMLVAADKRQAQIALDYINGFIDAVPMVKSLVRKRRAESIELRNRITIEVHAASFRSVRGFTAVAIIADETAFWRDDTSANPDVEILNALRPSMASVPGALLMCISTPYARRGALYQAYERYFGQDHPEILIWQSDSKSMNPTLSQGTIDGAYDRDAISAAAEYGAQFRRDIESFISREVIEACVATGRHELRRNSAHQYHAFVDPSGGSSDSMTLTIAHRAKDKIILDALREVKPPFSPEGVVKDFVGLLKRYGISSVVGDAYAGDWVREQFRKRGINYVVSSKVKNALYLDLLAKLNSSEVELLDNEKLQTQLLSLERRVSRLGRESIDHPANAHDDLANAVAGAVHVVGENLHEPDFDGVTFG